METSRRRAAVLACALCSATSLAQPVATLELPSCVAGSPPLRVPVSAERAVLDAADRRHFQQAAQARYPLYRRGADVPAQVLILRRDGHWLYVTVTADSPAGACFTAVFAAERFDFTAGWLGKYRPRGMAGED